MKRFKEWISIRVFKTPGGVVLLGILCMNLVLFGVAALTISHFAPASVINRSFWDCVFYTVSMVLDAGCIQYIIMDIGEASVAIIIICLVTVLLGMIIFTGAVIGYVSNWISSFIDKANSGVHKLNLYNHMVILNWNTRASEIINDMLYTGKREKIVVLVQEDKDAIEKSINERIYDTLEKEKKAGYSLKNRLTVLVREGDTYSTKQLNDLCLSQAKTIIILGSDISNTLCKFDYKERIDRLDKGNANTIKTLVQVAQITAAEDSADNQQIVIEVDDDWTLALVNKIIAQKARKGKCNIVPIAVNRILGQILSQFTIMPELNTVYSTLLSNKGAAFYVDENNSAESEEAFVSNYLSDHRHAIPLTLLKDEEGNSQTYFIADKEKAINKQCEKINRPKLSLQLNNNYKIGQKHIVILGHNSKSGAIMEGFNSFLDEWGDEGENILNIIVIDDDKNLRKQNYYKDYPYVSKVITADIFDKDIIYNAINNFIDSNDSDTSILILSDDTVISEEMDSNALSYLIYVQDIISERASGNPDFDYGSIDIVVEILNPKNYDVVHNYSVDNIVISNRYISKMVTQIGHKQSIFDFYNDILTYDENGADGFVSKELYIKKVSDFFTQIPPQCTAAELIRAVYNESPDENKSIILGYVDSAEKMILFDGDQNNINLKLTNKDKLIIFSNH